MEDVGCAVRVQSVDIFLSEKNASAAMSGDGDTDEDEEDVMPIQISWMTEQSQGDSKQGKTPNLRTHDLVEVYR